MFILLFGDAADVSYCRDLPASTVSPGAGRLHIASPISLAFLRTIVQELSHLRGSGYSTYSNRFYNFGE